MTPAEILQPACSPINDFPLQNTGVFEGRRFTDWISGPDKVSGLKYEVVNTSGDWRNFLPVGEKQWFPNFDTMNCTGYSNNNLAEISLKFRTGYEFNFSDRAMSVMAECQPNGNWLYKPADVGKNLGRILESDYPDDLGNPQSWNEYNKYIPPSILNKAIRFDEQYEWVGTDKASLLYHLKQAPIQITIPGDNPIHAVVLVHVEGNNYWYFDSYEQAIGSRKVGGTYLKIMTQPPASALKIVVKPMSQSIFYHKSQSQEYGFILPALSPDALKNLALVLGHPEIIKGDGTVDFAQAREVGFLSNP